VEVGLLASGESIHVKNIVPLGQRSLTAHPADVLAICGGDGFRSFRFRAGGGGRRGRTRLMRGSLGVLENNASRRTEEEMQQDSQPDELVLKNQAAPYPDSVEAVRELADTYADQNRWDEAIGQYQIAIKLDSASSDLYNSLGIAYEEVGRLEEAERAYQQAIALNTKDSMPYYNLAIMYEKQQRIPEAVQTYGLCLQHSIDHSKRSEVKKR
jgi:tetratricopeptide (TPR) repeat protein